jgi:hypothetical protein
MPDLVVAEHRRARVRALARHEPCWRARKLGRGWELGLERLHDAGELGADLVGVGLVKDRAQQRQHPGWAPLGTSVARLRA